MRLPDPPGPGHAERASALTGLAGATTGARRSEESERQAKLGPLSDPRDGEAGIGKEGQAEELVSEHDEEGAGEEEWRQQQID